MISQYTKLAKVEPIADVGFDFFAKAALYKSEKIQQTKGLLQSTLAGFTNTVDILKEPDRQYFNEKVKNVVDNLNSYKDVDLSDPNTVYQLQSMLGEVKQDKKISDDIVSTANFRNVQKEHNLMMSNPKFKDLSDPLLYQADQEKMQEYLDSPGGKFTQQHASINPNIEKQLKEGYESVAEKKQVGLIGTNIVTQTIKNWGDLYENGQNIATKNADYYTKTFDVAFNLKKNPNQAIVGINNLLDSQYKFFKNKKIELEVAQTTSSDTNLYKNQIQNYENMMKKLETDKQLVSEGKDIDQIKTIGLNAYIKNTAIQQANKGYSYTSAIKWSEQSKFQADAKLKGMVLDKQLANAITLETIKNDNDIKSQDKDLENKITLKQMDVNGDLLVAGVRKDGKDSSGNSSSNNMGSGLLDTVPNVTEGKVVDYYEQNKQERLNLNNEIIGLQKDLSTLMMEQSSSNSKIKATLQQYPELGTKMMGDKTLQSMLAAANMLSSMSGTRIENGATAEGVIKVMNKIKEKTLLLTLKMNENNALVNTTGNSLDKYNKAYGELYGSTTIKRDISLNILNNPTKETQRIYDGLMPELSKGAIVDKNNKPFDNNFRGQNDGEKILKDINWDKSEKRAFNLEKMTLEIIPKDKDGKSIYKEPVKIKLTSDFVSKMRLLGYNNIIETINKPNTELDYFLKSSNNIEAVKLVKQRTFFVDTDIAKDVPKGTVLEYQITDVKNPIPSLGDSRKDHLYDVNIMVSGKPISIQVKSTSQINELVNKCFVDAKPIVDSDFAKLGKVPSRKEYEEEIFKTGINILTQIKKNGR